MKRSWNPASRYIVFVLLAVGILLLIWTVREMIAPLVIAGLIAYIMNPTVNLFKRLGLKHVLAVNLVYFLTLGLIIAVLVILVPVLINELTVLSVDLMDVLFQAQDFLATPVTLAGIELSFDLIVPRPDESLARFISTLPENALHLVERTSRNAAWFLVIVVTIYYLLLDWDRVREWIIRLAPESHRLDARRVYLEVKKVWAAYLRGTLALMFIVAIVFILVYLAIGLPGAVILGLVTGLFSIVPELGPLIAALIAILVALLEGSNFLRLSNIWFAVVVTGVYLILINLKNIWLRPFVMGRSVHMHEGVVFVAILAAVLFQGILGALVIVPVLASAIVIGRYLRKRLLGQEPFHVYRPRKWMKPESPDKDREEKKHPKRTHAKKKA